MYVEEVLGYVDLVYGVALRLTGSADEAEALTQQTVGGAIAAHGRNGTARQRLKGQLLTRLRQNYLAAHPYCQMQANG